MNDTISRQAAIDALNGNITVTGRENAEAVGDYVMLVTNRLRRLPPVQPDIAEKLYQYKCYITDQEGLQHEVIHVGDMRRVTGWEI